MTPNFETMYSAHESEMLKDAYEAITKCDMWEWLKTFTPHANEGFLLVTHPNLDILYETLKYQGHSGSSWAWTMRIMQNIAKIGWTAHLRNHTSVRALESWAQEVRTGACPCRQSKGFTTEWCGVAGGGVPACDH